LPRTLVLRADKPLADRTQDAGGDALRLWR
jgi:hypothetical protein